MVGRRVEYAEFWGAATRQPGDYCKVERKTHHGDHLAWVWYACTPNGLVGNLEDHTVTEHEDGTITVDPSILVERIGEGEVGYHGHLVAGVWSP